MLTLYYNETDGNEYWTHEQIEANQSSYSFIVVGMLLPATNGNDMVAPVLYKGDSEEEAKKIWLTEPMMSNFIVHNGKTVSSEYRYWLDIKDVDYEDGVPGIPPKIEGINYLVKFYSPDPNLPRPVHTRQLKEANNKMWYTVRITDLDIHVPSFVGQIIYCGASKQEAVDAWGTKDGYHIFQSELHEIEEADAE